MSYLVEKYLRGSKSKPGFTIKIDNMRYRVVIDSFGSGGIESVMVVIQGDEFENKGNIARMTAEVNPQWYIQQLKKVKKKSDLYNLGFRKEDVHFK
jgi:hypothetical protein